MNHDLGQNDHVCDGVRRNPFHPQFWQYACKNSPHHHRHQWHVQSVALMDYDSIYSELSRYYCR